MPQPVQPRSRVRAHAPAAAVSGDRRGEVTGEAAARGFRYTATGIGKAFSGAPVLRDVSLILEPGEIHTLLGENGAGKSTLLKILAGVYQPDSGELVLGDERLPVLTPRTAQQRGIYLVPQEPTLMRHLSVVENLFLGILPRGRLPFSVGWREMRRAAAGYLERVGLNVEAETPAEALSIAQAQLLECARALAHRCDVLFFDEPTSPLTDHEADVLFETIRALREQRYTLAFISHRLDEVLEISDRITVLRDGALVATQERASADRAGMVRAMVGRELAAAQPRPRRMPTGPAVLRVTGLTLEPHFANVDLEVRSGEVVGLAGLVGSGRTEIAEAIFGVRKPTAGRVVLDGKQFDRRSPRACIDAGLVYLSEDRGRHGIFAEVDLARNVTSGILPRLPRRAGLLQIGAEHGLAAEAVRRTNVRAASLASRIKTLSGGNQQRALLARWLLADPKVAILDEPTRGVDIGAKAEIYEIVAGLAAAGLATIVISSEIEELTQLCDRVFVAYEGRIVGRLSGAEITAGRLGSLVVGAEVR